MRSDPKPALETLLAEEPYVRALARALVADEADADEVVQQSWLRVLEHGGDDIVRPRWWLGRIVRNVAHNLRRSDRRRQAREQLVALAAAVPSSAEWMEREERRRRLVELVDALPTEHRAVLLLRYFEGLPPRRIATRLGLPVGTVWNLHRRALQRLRRDLGANTRRDGVDRRVWLAPLLGQIPATPGVLSGTAPIATLTGGLWMATKGKVLCGGDLARARVLRGVGVGGIAITWCHTGDDCRRHSDCPDRGDRRAHRRANRAGTGAGRARGAAGSRRDDRNARRARDDRQRAGGRRRGPRAPRR